MKLLLCSDFSGVGYKFLDKFFDKTEGLKCLFVGYAQDDPYEYMSGTAQKFKDMGNEQSCECNCQSTTE